MKPLICCMVVLTSAMLVSSLPALSQVQFALGLKAGLNLSSVSVDPDPYSGLQQAGVTSTKSGSTGFAVGAVAELNFGKMFAIALEPGYTQKGTKWELTQGQAKATDERTVSYLQIPVLFRVKFLEGQVRPYGFAGPNIGFVLSSKAKFQGFANIQDGEYDVKSTTSSTDFGLEFGGGAEVKLAKQVALTGDVRFNLGLSNLISSPAQAGQTSSAKSRSLLIQLGVLFLL